MVAAETQKPATTAKRRRRWFRLRFGLRTLLFFVTAVAVWLSYESWRAQNQEALVARVDAMSGVCIRLPREWIPRLVHGLLDKSQSEYTYCVVLEAQQVPIRGDEELFEPAEVQELLRMPGMAEVRDLRLEGAAVTDAVLDELASIRDLHFVQLTFTAVSEEAVKEFESRCPSCRVVYPTLCNGTAAIARHHSDSLSLVDDLSVFLRASRNDPIAIRILLDAAGGEAVRDHARELLVPFFRQIDRQTILPLAVSALQHDALGTRLLAVKTLAGHHAIDLLEGALDDPAAAVRLEVVNCLAEISGSVEAVPLSNPCRRIRAMGKDPRNEMMTPATIALNDENTPVRRAAARLLGKIAGSHAPEPLEAAAKDEYEFVRKAAEEALAKVGAISKE